jgi:hypothetical protein
MFTSSFFIGYVKVQGLQGRPPGANFKILNENPLLLIRHMKSHVYLFFW